MTRIVKKSHLDDIQPTPSDGAKWKPIRGELGIQAFGMSAYVGEPGELVVPPHSEQPGGGAGAHEELYLVVQGRAVFTVAGEQVDAPAGALLLFQPGEYREAVAEAPGTTVLVVGGKRGEPFSVSPWEYPALIRHARHLGRFDEARALAREGTERFGEHPFLLYEQACAEAAAGREAEATALLRRAAELGDSVRELAGAEPLLQNLQYE